MSLVTLQNASFDFGRERILHQANVNLFAGVKYGLVGDNGAGKTTLLAILAGELPLHEGTRQAGARVRIRTLRQETTFDPGREGGITTYDVVAREAFSAELRLEEELAEVTRSLEKAATHEAEGLARRQGRLLAEYERLGGYAIRARLEAALLGLGLPEPMWRRPLGELSGGERRRAALAGILLAGGDLLLLDEPTNHLDLEACEWLEAYLGKLPSAAVVVSHDRQFLDRIATQTLHIGGGRLSLYSGDYSFFARARREQERQELAAWQRQSEMIRKTEDFIRRNIAGQKSRQAQSRRRKLAKVERLDRPPAAARLFNLRLEPQRQSGAVVMEIADVAKGYDGRPLLRGFSLLVTRGQRIGVVGPNGCGKSTLLRLLAGLELPDRGTVRLGHEVDLGLYDQQLRSVSDSRSVLEEMWAVDPAATEGDLRSFLAAFGFGPDLVDRSVGALSGGERARLALLRLIKEGHNTLLLDEPTNHLDIRSRESLEEALADYDGTIIVASHDRRFLDRIVTSLLVYGQGAGAGRVESFPGNYSAWHERRLADAAARQAAPPAPAPAASAVPAAPRRPQPAAKAPNGSPPGLSKNEIARRRRWMAEAEEAIGALERERAAAVTSLTDPCLAPERVRALGRRLEEIEAALAEKLALWEQWGREVEGATDPA